MKEDLSVFPDTNVFLHFPPIHEIDWCSVCDAKSVRLVVCLTVIHELDEKKSDHRLSSRAERAIKEIREAVKSGGGLRSGVTINIFNREIRASDFPDSLSPDSADDRIVHLAKLFREETPGSEVAIVTGDFGMELRAQAGGITAIELDSSLRLPNPQDELTKKYKQTFNELNALKIGNRSCHCRWHTLTARWHNHTRLSLNWKPLGSHSTSKRRCAGFGARIPSGMFFVRIRP